VAAYCEPNAESKIVELTLRLPCDFVDFELDCWWIGTGRVQRGAAAAIWRSIIVPFGFLD